MDVARAVREAKAGRVEFRVDRTALLHVPAGKLSFSDEALLSNVAAVIDAVMRAKPASSKGAYIRNIVLASTMSPGVPLDLQSALSLRV